MKNQKLLKTYFFIVDQIILRFGNDRKRDKLRLHTAFKAFYRREYGSSHTSLKDFQHKELNELINRILIEFSVEYGIYLLQPNDPVNAEELSLQEYWIYKLWDMREGDLRHLESIETLPEGYEPIIDIKQLKTLRKGKKIYKPDNMVWRYGIHLYQYSPISKCYYKKIFSSLTPMAKVEECIKKGVLYGPK